MGLGISKLHSVWHYVRDVRAAERVYRRVFGLHPLATCACTRHCDESSLSRLKAGDSVVVCAGPSRAETYRYLDCHPEGIGRVVFEVADVGAAKEFLRRNRATFVDEEDVRSSRAGCVIATPIPHLLFEFLARPQYLENKRTTTSITPGIGVTGIDHLAVAQYTACALALWLESVLGFVATGEFDVHTGAAGSGMYARNLREPGSGLTIACLEPKAPNYFASQVFEYCEANRGPGVQHLAFEVADLEHAAAAARSAGARLSWPGATQPDPETEAVPGANRPIAQLFTPSWSMLQGDLREPAALFFELIERTAGPTFTEENARALFQTLASRSRDG